MMPVWIWIKRHYTAVIITVFAVVLSIMAIINRSTTLHDAVLTRLVHLRSNLAIVSSVYTRTGAQPLSIPPESDPVYSQLVSLSATLEQAKRPIHSPTLIDQYDYTHATERLQAEEHRLSLTIHRYNQFVTWIGWSWLLRLAGVSPLPNLPN